MTDTVTRSTAVKNPLSSGRHAGKSGSPDRLTVTLTARVAKELNRLREMTGLSKTDLVNRALSLYHLTERELGEGKELAFYDPATGEYRRVHLT